MKFDPFQLKEIAINAEIHAPKGRVHVRCSAHASFFVQVDGYEVLAGFGQTLDLEMAEASVIRVEAPQGARAFMRDPAPVVHKVQGEVFTNPDRMPHESGALAEVLRAKRLLEMEQRKYLRELREERKKLEAAREPAPVKPAPELADTNVPPATEEVVE